MSGPWDFACMVAWLVATVTLGPVLWLADWCKARLAAVTLLPNAWAVRRSIGAWAYVPIATGGYGDEGSRRYLDFGLTLGELRHGSWGVRLGLGGCTLEASAEIHRQDRPRP